MIREILGFELRYHARRPFNYFFFALLFSLSFALIASDAIQIVGAVGLVKRNGPYAIAQLSILLTVIGLLFAVAIVGTSMLRDFRHKAHELLFTTHLSEFGYLAGRFVGSFVVMAIVFLAIPIGSFFGSMAPWIDPEFVLTPNFWWHLHPYLVFGLPTMFVGSAIFFAVGALTRSLVVVYCSGFGLLVAQSVAETWTSSLDSDAVANAVDMFGLTTLDLTTRYWTVAERNSLTIPWDQWMIANRSLWLGISIAIMIGVGLTFRFKAGRDQKPAKASKKSKKVRVAGASTTTPEPVFNSATMWHQLLGSAVTSTRHLVLDKVFIALVLISGVNTFMNAWFADTFYGVTTWPVTFVVAELVIGGFFLFVIILSTIYAGEAVWRERGLGTEQILDSTPVDTWVLMTGKIISVTFTLTLLLVLQVPVGILAQLFKGFTDIDIGLYFVFIFGTQFPWLVAIILFSFAVHSLVQHKFIGHTVLVLYWIGSIVIASLGFEHQLLNVGISGGIPYSDMNGFGHFVTNLSLQAGYSVSIGLMGLVLAALAWSRGTDNEWTLRVQIAKKRWRPRTTLALSGAATLTIVFGGSIFYNTNVLNEYVTTGDREELVVQWERTYRPLIHLATPRIIDVDVTVELDPENRAFTRDGRYLVVNKHNEAIDSVLVSYPESHTVERFAWGIPATEAVADSATGTFLFTFDQPLEPGDTTTFEYRYGWASSGFPNSGSNTRIVANGSFLTGSGPTFGYDESFEMSDPADRREYELPTRNRLPDLDDPEALENGQFNIDADHVRFAATIGTAPNQIAIAPGYLVREWEEGGKKWYRYEMDQPIAHFASFVSADYTIARDQWNDVDIAIYHHETHTYNIERMLESVKASLEYFTENFSPYQFKELRILEFPRYASFAQSFSATIPYSEAIGFITRVRDDDDDLDMPFFVTAHEVAHQWWGHQVVGARAQGSQLMVESMAEYAALTVMEKRYGPSHARKFLQYELDTYLRGRGSERIREQPLIRSENQAYIHYYKGSLALYALRDYIGEEAMNRGLRSYLENHAYEEAPYSTSRDFLGYLKTETPDSLQYVFEDLFETITLWDNRVDEVTVSEIEDGRFAVDIHFTARKVRADSLGVETEIPMADYIDVGVFAEEEEGNTLGRPLSVYKILVNEGEQSVRVIVNERPERAGIDPYNKLIDRVSTDNVREASAGS